MSYPIPRALVATTAVRSLASNRSGTGRQARQRREQEEWGVVERPDLHRVESRAPRGQPGLSLDPPL